MKKYFPIPITVKKEEMPITFLSILEELAQNVHETWADGRIREGWTYGIVRNDERKKHPSLIPFDDLSESEKEYDRRTALATLTVLMKHNLIKTK